MCVCVWCGGGGFVCVCVWCVVVVVVVVVLVCVYVSLRACVRTCVCVCVYASARVRHHASVPAFLMMFFKEKTPPRTEDFALSKKTCTTIIIFLC